jgi:hypothetical protein
VWYEVARHAGHNFVDGADGGLVSRWLLRVLDGSLR